MRKNRFILFIVITAISLAFGGCSESISETDQHRYFSKGGKFYIHYEQDYTEDPQLYYVESPVYDSYDEMIAVLTENIATDETREYLQRRYGDKNGNIRVFDADGMKQATHPDFEFFKLSFNNKVAGSYDIILKHRLDSITQALRVTVFPDADIYDEHFEEDTAYYVTHEKTESAELPEKNAKEYYFDSLVRDSRYSSSLGCTLREHSEYKALHYSLSASEDKSIYVIENYEKEKGVFGDMPTDIIVYVKEGDVCYRISTEWVYDEPPTEEWLLSFGMEPYVPEDTATE